MDLHVDSGPLAEAGLPEDVAERARAVAAAPVSLVSGVDLALIGAESGGRDAVVDLVHQAAQAYAEEIETENGAERVAALRAELAARGLDGFVVPMADEYQNEFVPQHARRLAWLSGFMGSAGTVVVLGDKAAVFVDGRYTLQVREQVDLNVFETKSVADVSNWIADSLQSGQKLAYDPWLHTETGVASLREACERAGAELVAVESNPVDAVWTDRPPRPL
ncbi:MAG: aminopeptidase P family protein, partial [Alphaproteobacteria bacterium]|nr:aminopeptidase P family protein [Alphaproteobacteria bacterium]